jgi:large subunit ribosomal protein L19
MIQDFEKDFCKKDLPEFAVGDTLCVSFKLIEGDKERLQNFTGTVIAKKGYGLSTTVTLYRNAYGCSMERVFLIHSPIVAGIKKVRGGKVRRAKLYYLRGASGKAAKVQEKMGITISKSFIEQREEETQKEMPSSETKNS